MNRQDAYKQVFESIEKVTGIDRKGEWTAGELIRTGRREGVNHYVFYITYKPDPAGAPRAELLSSQTLRIFVWSTDEPDSLKRRIRSAAGYTPSPAVVQLLWAYFRQLHEAYAEEDRYYAAADAGDAVLVLSRLHQRAVDRFCAGTLCIPKDRARHYPLYERYLTDSEQKEAKEAQKAINGHGYVEPMSLIHRTGHLADFNRQLGDEIDRIQKERELEAKRAQDRTLADKLETDVSFRALVAHAVAAAKEIRVHQVEVELAHRLFGYTRNLDEYREAYRQLSDSLQLYGLRSYDASKLANLGRAYLEQGGILPAVVAPYERMPDQFYYGDDVHDGLLAYEVQAVGRKYVYVSGNAHRKMKEQLRLFDRADRIERPSDPKAYLYNEFVRLHNNKWIPEAHRSSISDVCKRLLKSRVHQPYRIRQLYERKRDIAIDPAEKAAYTRILQELEIIALEDRIRTIGCLSGTPKEAYDKAVQELADVRAAITFEEAFPQKIDNDPIGVDRAIG